jgi:hypothetical protein
MPFRQSNAANEAILGPMSRRTLRAAAALSLLAVVGGCRTLAPSPPGQTTPTAAAPAASACGDAPLVFHPRAGVTYRARVEEKRGVYHSSLTYERDGAGGWIAVERGFSLQYPGQPDPRWSGVSKGELRWKLDGRGVPVGAPEAKGYKGPCCLESFSFFTFAPVGFANASTCPGAAWNAEWLGMERERSFRFRIEHERGPTGSASVSVDGSIKTPANEWKLDGTFEVSLEDGLTGGGTLRVRGPGAPAVNDLSRQIRISPGTD